MEVSCPNCYTSYTVSAEKIPEQGVTPTCKKCGTTFTIVRASGDPVKDRANRMKGFVVLRERNRANAFQNRESTSAEGSDKKFDIGALYEKRSFKVGVCIAGVVILLLFAGFYQWKNIVHKRFEEALRSALAHAPDSRFALKFRDVKFSAFGGLTRDTGCIQGLHLAFYVDDETPFTLDLVDEIRFELKASQKHFITEPFDIELNIADSELALKNCVIEAQENQGWAMEFRVDQTYAGTKGLHAFTAQGIAFFFDFRGEEWKEDQRFLIGDANFGFIASHIESSNITVGRNVDILFSIRNGIFAKDEYATDASALNYLDMFQTKWGDNGTIMSVEHCSAEILGSSVQLAGQLAFHNPVLESEFDLLFTAKDFSHIMKFIHRMNEAAFDKIVFTLVALEEQDVHVYRQGTDVFNLNLSYKNSKIRINDQEITNPI